MHHSDFLHRHTDDVHDLDLSTLCTMQSTVRYHTITLWHALIRYYTIWHAQTLARSHTPLYATIRYGTLYTIFLVKTLR